ncbi:DNA replication and repair protein RecF [Methylopila capsulata]|uniref:DNA replication and repair protein RecF n=1 Tax=Methylopila capsulata TaxID=61654 RepID=A0A9W6ISD3_9HYPH|nr:DNA replication/repair protein RecF [Methylopila capsulata]MBM7851697.1 DNA replication and repair protein RecF [Methylopila capsulata]GLK54757.1 DNA replication and repair protein RecF [Methylopila capsulata]
MTGTSHRRAGVSRLRLTNFRSYPALDLHSGEGSVALVGPNGAGKTNILEAISLLAPGRGLRRAPHGEFARTPGDGSWAVAAEIAGDDDGPTRLGTGVEPAQDATGRRCRIDGAPVSGAGAFSEHLRLVWLTPDLDGLFRGPAGDRRRFLDRLVNAADPAHAARASGLERALRSRNRLLEDPRADARWVDAVERELAELAISVAAARVETVARLAALVAETAEAASPFPTAEVALEGSVEAELAHLSATAAEDAYRERLGRGRPRDRAAGRTLEGPHLSDLLVRHAAKDMPAEKCSTGEQKALLVGLVLAHARLVARLDGRAPVVLLDEVAAHLDPVRRAALYGALDALGAQVWLTGADPAAFADLGGRATVFSVTDGDVRRGP